MTEAGHNVQRELKDVNNLWRWPTTGYSSASRQPNDIFKPEFMKWMRVSDVGYLGAPDSLCQFTDISVTAMSDGGYHAGLFLDLNAGNYVVSFEATDSGELMFVRYVRQDEDNIKFGNYKTKSQFAAGHNDIQFSIPENVVISFQIIGKAQYIPVTLTDIVIREGVL